jgi:hypothetical protein
MRTGRRHAIARHPKRGVLLRPLVLDPGTGELEILLHPFIETAPVGPPQRHVYTAPGGSSVPLLAAHRVGLSPLGSLPALSPRGLPSGLFPAWVPCGLTIAGTLEEPTSGAVLVPRLGFLMPKSLPVWSAKTVRPWSYARTDDRTSPS